MSRMRKSVGPTILALIAGVLFVVAAPASAAVQLTLHVAPDGVGSDCLPASPCSLHEAQSQARSLAPGMTGDIVIELSAGKYALDGPLTFGPEDSGNNGHVVRYQAAAGQSPVITGGEAVSGWTVHDSAKNIWVATVPVGTKGRQLYVDGKRARLAFRSKEAALGTVAKTSTGYNVSKTAIASWTNVKDVEFVYPAGGYDGSINPTHAPWSWSLCNVQSVSGGAVTMEPDCFANGTGPVQHSTGQPWLQLITVPTYIQNNYALLSGAGQFYLDSNAGKVYYIPRNGENLATADVQLATLESLLSASASGGESVHDLQIVGLTFEYATWIPDRQFGVIDIQSNMLEHAPNYQADDPADLRMLPSNITFRGAQRVLFQGNTLRHLGGSGLEFSGGGDHNVVNGNAITDVSGSGITIGDGIGLFAPADGYESHATVSNNYVQHAGAEYQGAIGIFAGWVKHTHISHNELTDLPGGGIALGWGWNNPNEMVDNHIDHNYVHDTMTSALKDGGPIYVLNDQLDSPRSTITNNFVDGTPQNFGSIYLDGRASHFDVQNNVVANTKPGWIYLQNIASSQSSRPNTATNNLVTDNYADTTKQYIAPNGTDPSNTVANNHLGLTSWPTEARAIISNAGLEPAWSSIRRGPVVTNLALGAVAYASSNSLLSTTAGANDGDSQSLWESSLLANGAWWEVDLGAQYALTKVEVLSRQDYPQSSPQANLQVWVSNTASMSSGYTVACLQNAERLPFREAFICEPPPGTWRYVAVVKTSGQLSIGELRAYGH